MSYYYVIVAVDNNSMIPLSAVKKFIFLDCDSKRHYRLANVALVGEAITLAMRTNVSHNH